MSKAGPLFRSMWAMAGVAAALLLALGSLADVLIFMLAYSGPAGSYGGQAGDRHTAWLLLIWLVVLWVAVLGGMIAPTLRWRRRGMLGAPED